MTTASGCAARSLLVRFDSYIELTIHDAFLASAGLLQCDPIARIHLVTVKTTRSTLTKTTSRGLGNGADGTVVTISAREVGHTSQKLFTAHPSFDETTRFYCTHNSSITALAGQIPQTVSHGPGVTPSPSTPASVTEMVEDYVVITLEDGGGSECYGQAYCPFSPHCPSTAATPVRAMLRPRNAQDPHDPLFRHDCATLAARRLDHFGFVAVSWRVTMIPHGGALFVPATTAPSEASADAVAPSLPVGLVLRATWLAPATTIRADPRSAAQYVTSVEFGGADRFLFGSTAPLRLTVHSADQLERAVFHCTVQHVQSPELACDVAIALPLPSLSLPQAFDRDVHWTAPVRTAQGRDLGMLLVCIRLSRETSAAGTAAISTTAAAASGSAEAIGRVVERERKRACVEQACPAVEHVRHLFEVLMGRATLDPAVARIAALFFDHADAAELSTGQLKEFMVACAFHCAEMNAQQAARFCFVALRHSLPDAVSVEEVHYIVQKCLVDRSVQMSDVELRHIVADIFGNATMVTFADYTRYLLHNYAVWAELGVPLSVDLACSSAQRGHYGLLPALDGVDASVVGSCVQSIALRTADKTTQRRGCTVEKATSSKAVWRSFVVRVPSTHRAFYVTAHVNDTVSDVMTMIEESIGIKAARQEWRLNGEVVLEAQTAIGSTALGLPSALRKGMANGDCGGDGNANTKDGEHGPEVWVREQEELLSLNFYYKDKHKRWRESMPATAKVLQVRAAVQRRTLIPLSRCVLTIRRGLGSGETTKLQDRHPLSYYQLHSGDCIVVTQE